MQGEIQYTYIFDEQTQLDFTVDLDSEAGAEVAGESYPG